MGEGKFQIHSSQFIERDDFKMPLHLLSTQYGLGLPFADAARRVRVREALDCAPAVIGVTLHEENEFSRAINSRIARACDEDSAGTTGCTANNTCRDSQCGCREEGVGRPDKSNVCTLVRCTMETPRERSHLSLQASRASFGPAVRNRQYRDHANYSRISIIYPIPREYECYYLV